METFLKTSFIPKRLRFIVMADVLPDNILQSDFMVFVSKDDFDKLGILKKEKEDLLKAFSDDMLINLSDNNEDLLNDYIISCINSSFKNITRIAKNRVICSDNAYLNIIG